MKSQSSAGCNDWHKGYKNIRSPKSWSVLRKSSFWHVLVSIDLGEWYIVDGLLDNKAE